MDQIQNRDVALPVFGEEMKSEALNFCLPAEAEFTAGPTKEEICSSTSSDGSDLALEASVNAKVTEMPLGSDIWVNEQSREVTGSTELLTDAWDNLTYDGAIVSFECGQDSWKLDDEQFDCLVSQYVPDIPDNGASASALPAETRYSGITDSTNSICLSNMETELSEILDMNSGAKIGEFSAARTSGDKILGTAQQPATLADTKDMQTGMLASDLNVVHEAGVTLEQHDSVNWIQLPDDWIQHPEVNRNSVPGSLANEIAIGTANCEYNQVTGSDSQGNLSLRKTLLPDAENNLICGKIATTETNLLCDEQFESSDSTGSGSDLIQNENSRMTSKKENQSKSMADTADSDTSRIICSSKLPDWSKSDEILSIETTETNLLCDEQFESSDSTSTGSGSDLTQNRKCEHSYSMTSNKENQSKNMANTAGSDTTRITTETNLFCDEQFESSDSTSTGSGSDLIRNEKCENNSSITSKKENQSKNLADTTDTTRIMCSSKRPDWDKHDEILSTETNLLCDEQFESSDSTGSGSDLVQNRKVEHSSNMTSKKENQSKNMADTTDSDTTRIISSSKLPDFNKNDEILSCESGEKKTLEPVLPCSLSSESDSNNALPTSELTSSSMICKLRPDVVAKESSQTPVTIDDIDSFIQIVKAAASCEHQPVCSNPSDSLALAVPSEDLPNRENANSEGCETRSAKNCEPLLTESSNQEGLLDFDSSSEEVLLLEYSNHEETGGDVNKDMPSEKIMELSDETSENKDVLRSGSHVECCDQVLPSADVALSVTDNTEAPLWVSTVLCGQLPTDSGNSDMESLVITLVTRSSNTDQPKETSNLDESTDVAHESKDFLQKDKKDSFDVVHQKNEDVPTSVNVSADDSTSKVHKSPKSDECRSSDKNNMHTPKRGCEKNLIVVDEMADSSPTDGDIDSVVKHMKKEKPWTFGDEASPGEDSWKDPVPHGLKECFCPHGNVTVQAGHFHCQECGLASVYKNSTVRHEVMKHRVKHTNVKIMHCKLCPSVFVHSREFRRHSQKHARKVASDVKGEEEKSSDSEILQQDSSVTPSSESSPSRTNSISLRRCKRSSSFGWNWKVAFDFQTQKEQRAKKRKSDQITSGKDSSAVEEKPAESSRSNLAKLDNKNDLENEKEAEINYYNITELHADGTRSTIEHPSYDGVLLPVLTKPCNKCPICYRKFSNMTVQKKHYAQVHKIYIQGTALYKCKPCELQCVSLYDFKSHLQTERHRTVFGNLKASGSAETSPAADCASPPVDTRTPATSGSRSSTRKRRSSNSVIAEELQLSKKLRYSDSSENLSSRKLQKKKRPLTRTCQSDRSSKMETETSKEILSKKISRFYGSMEKNGLSPEIHLHACVSNHVCTSACICELATKDKMPSKMKHMKKKKREIPGEKCSEGIESMSPTELFQPVIVDSFSCLPSTWTNISDITSDENGSAEEKASQNLQVKEKLCKTEPDKELPSQFASNTTKAIKFFQNTRRTFFTTSLQNTLKPQETVPQIKPRSPVALKSTSHQASQRLEDSAEGKTSLQNTLKPQETVPQIKPRSPVALKSTSHQASQRLEDSAEGKTSLQNTLKPQETVPQIKPRSQVALKSTSHQTSRRLGDSAEGKTLRSHKTVSKEDSHDVKNSIIIRLSDDEDDSSHSPTVALDSGSCKSEVGTIRSKSLGCSDPVRNKTFSRGDSDPADVLQLDEAPISSRSKTRRSVNTPSTSRSVDATTPAERSVLSDFHSDVLCSELQKRGFMKRCTCGVFFLGLPTYNLHCAWHSSGSPLSCSVCNVVSKDWYEFYSHIQNHCK